MRDDTRYAALVHDTLPLSHPEFWSPAKRLVQANSLLVPSPQSYDHVSSRRRSSMHDELRRLTGRDSRVVRFGCGQLTDEEADAALTSPLPIRKPYFLYVGALEPRKGLLTLLDAFERLIGADRTEFRLLLAGGGSQTTSHCSGNASAGASAHVELVENPGRGDSPRLVAEAGARSSPRAPKASGFRSSRRSHSARRWSRATSKRSGHGPGMRSDMHHAIGRRLGRTHVGGSRRRR